MAKNSTPADGDPMSGSAPTEPAIIEAAPALGAEDVPEPPKPGDTIANPAEPFAPTRIPEKADLKTFSAENVSHAGYPKTLWHPVHGALEIPDPNAESGLLNRNDWSDSAELADARRTPTEALTAQAHNQRAKLEEHYQAGRPIVRNSAQADESVKSGAAEPL